MSLRVERDGGVAVVTLDRPERLNAFDQALFDALAPAFEALARDATVRAVVLTGAGRAFCAGADIAEPVELADEATALEWMRDVGRGPLALHDLPQPTVAAIHGPAAGGGLGLALACDVRIAGPQAAFRATFAPMGLVPDFGVARLLPQSVGYTTAMDLLLSCRRVDAQEALTLGLVARIEDDPLAAACELAARVAALPADAGRQTKAVVRAALAADHKTTLMDLEAPAQARNLASRRFRERAAAWYATKGE